MQTVHHTDDEPERMTTDQSREYLVTFMEQHFTDKTFHRYIRGERGAVNLAGDFAWQMARALRALERDEVVKGSIGEDAEFNRIKKAMLRCAASGIRADAYENLVADLVTRIDSFRTARDGSAAA